MIRTRTQVQKFYLALQDGRAEGEKEYESEEAAERALHRDYGQAERRGMYVACYWSTTGEAVFEEKPRTWPQLVQDLHKRLGREPNLWELLHLAKGYEMTPEEVEEQRQS